MIIQMYFNVVNVIVVNASCESWCHSAPCIVIASSVIGIYREQCYDPSFWHCPSLCYVLSVRTAHTWGGTYPRNLGLATFWDILGKLLKWDFFDGNHFNNYWRRKKQIISLNAALFYQSKQLKFEVHFSHRAIFIVFISPRDTQDLCWENLTPFPKNGNKDCSLRPCCSALIFSPNFNFHLFFGF